MLTVHHLANSQSERIVWLCEELGLPYTFVRYQRTVQGGAPPEYKALHPAATAPIVEVDGIALAETGAIIEYLARRYAGGRLLAEPDSPDYAAFLFWFHYGNGSLIPAFMMNSVAARLGSDPLSRRVEVGFAMAEQRLAEAPWFAGEEFTAADIMMTLPLTQGIAGAKYEFGEIPNVRAYLDRVMQLPAYRAAMAKAEPDRMVE